MLAQPQVQIIALDTATIYVVARAETMDHLQIQVCVVAAFFRLERESCGRTKITELRELIGIQRARTRRGRSWKLTIEYVQALSVNRGHAIHGTCLLIYLKNACSGNTRALSSCR